MSFVFKSLAMGICCLLLTAPVSWAQKAPLKWGKLSGEEWGLKEVSFDPEASAVILHHYGTAKFSGSNLSITYHKRIKILKPQGVELADVEIPYYSKDRNQRVVGLKAQTHNSERGSQELSNQDFYTAPLSEGWSKVSFTFPNAEVGAILEYSYTLVSENVVFLRTWDFQADYPTLHSEFRAAIPEYLNYKVVFQGRRVLQKYAGNSGSQWVLNNLESLKPEPYMTTINDFRERLRFQLTGYYVQSDVGGVEFKSLMTTWKALGSELWTHGYFGDQIKKRALAKSISEGSLQVSGDDLNKIKQIYKYVTQNYQWNGDHDILANPLKSVVESKEGTSADLNLLLCMLLRHHEVDAEPVLISTRDHGMVTKNIPLLSQFDQVLVRANTGEEHILMNATDPVRPYDLLALQDMNKFGLVVPPNKEPYWIDLPLVKNNVRNFIIKIDLANLEDPQTSVQGSYNGHYASNLRRKIRRQEADILPCKSELTLELTTKNEYELQKPLLLSSEQVDLELLQSGPLLYIEPMFLNLYSENPFKAPKRNYPIDFGATFKENYFITIVVPEGYSVEEVPEEISLKLPRSYGYFQYHTEVNPTEIRLIARLGITESTMGYGMYPSLQQFFDLVIEKFNAQVVLKKN